MLQRYPWSILVGSRDGYLWREEKYLVVIVVLIRNAPRQLPPPTPTPFHAAGTGGDLQIQNALSPTRGEISHPVGKLVVFRQVCFGIPSSAACPSPFYWCLHISQ